MSEQYDNKNSGALFRNEKKRSENSPDHTGQVQIVCPGCGGIHDYWLSAWVKKARATGQKFFSLAFTAKEEANATGSRTSVPDKDELDDFDDDIPF